jgi:hypothetical protein
MIETVPVRDGDKPQTYGEGRICRSCPTVLSRFNPRTRCAQCDPMEQRLSLRQHREAMFSLAEFMQE